MDYRKCVKGLSKSESKLYMTCQSLSRRVMRRFPKWHIIYNYRKGRVYKKVAIIMEHHYIKAQKIYEFEIDMRENWKKDIKRAFNKVEDFLRSNYES